MNIEAYREYCLRKPHTTEDFPFDENVLVFRIGGKIYSLCDVNSFESANLKCDPERAVELRERYEGIVPGYHMNKVHWNTVSMNGSVPDSIIRELVDQSYDLIKASLSKKVREQLG
jgi:predicted DNA-binding protein (MmcQ/YjbR family)